MFKYEKTHQQKRQDIVSFTVYLNSIDNELRYNDEQQQRHFLMKMHSALQRKIQEMPEPSVNYHVLIDYVQQLKGLKGYRLKTEPVQN